MADPYQLHLAPAARRALQDRLSLAVAVAVWEFCTGPLAHAPRQVGKPLGRELTGYLSARRGAYRVIYRIDEPAHTVLLIRIEHRADVYRRR